jgi:clan AA aspartic protease (TIGR02281 family)
VEASSGDRSTLARGRLFATVLVVFVLAGSGLATAEIYQWTDASGRLHFSQDLSQVPASQRARAEADAKKPRARDPLQVYGSRGGSAPGPAARTQLSVRSGRAMRIPFERHGTLMKVEVLLNGRVRVPFFIDTGASGVSIPWAVAKQLGLRIGPDTPQIQVRTANGVISEPLVPLASVQLGPARVDDVTAAVSTTMDIGLLGGAFFNNFVYQVDAAAGVITLVPNAGVRGGHGRDAWLARFEEIRGPLEKVGAYIDKGGFLDDERVHQLETHRDELRVAMEELEREASRKGVPRSWRR